MSKAAANSSKNDLNWVFTTGVIVIELIIAIAIYKIVLGNPTNFQGDNVENLPKPGNILGIVYKGGIIVPILMALFMINITFAIERGIAIFRAKGKGDLKKFIRNIQTLTRQNNLDGAIAECDKQRGSLANVMRAGIVRYKELASDTHLDKDQKVLSLQKELEEATALELPMLSQNMVIIATITSIATLIGLIGTVIGMIRAFSALGEEGGAGATQELSIGISEALINTALGISTSTLAIIFYNYFSSSIDNLTYKIDESGFSLVQTFAANNK